MEKSIKGLIDPVVPMEDQLTLMYRNWQRMRAERLYWILKAMTLIPIYIRNSIQDKITFCNVAALDVFGESAVVWRKRVKVGKTEEPLYGMGNEIHAFDYRVEDILRENSPDTVLVAPIRFMETEAIKEMEKGNVRLVTPKMAQEYANVGVPIMVISAQLNHVAVVAPNLEWSANVGGYIMRAFNETLGPFTGNVGANNGMFYVGDKQAFGGHPLYKTYLYLYYVQFRRRDGDFDELD